MSSLNEMKANLARERQVVKDMIGAIKATREAIKVSRQMQSALRAEIRRETRIDRIVKEDHRAAVKAAREAKRAEKAAARAAKAEAKRLKAGSQRMLRIKQQRPSALKIATPEEINEMNAKLGIV